MKKIYIWVCHKSRVLLLSMLLAMSNVEIQILKTVGGRTKTGGIITKMLFRSTLLEKFYAGKHDEKYVRKFYDILKRADKFIKTASENKIGAAADRYARTYGKKDTDGRKHEHFGFFDDKHKYHGKTLEEVIELELEERRTKDDNYKIIQIINNKPIDIGFSKIDDILKPIKKENGEVAYVAVDMYQKSKKHKFPIEVGRKNKKCVNKIEQLTDFLHIKRKPFEYRRFEFFIPLKYKTTEYPDDSKIIKDILNIDEIYVKDEYGDLTGYVVNDFVKRFKHNNLYEVFRFDAVEMEKLS